MCLGSPGVTEPTQGRQTDGVPAWKTFPKPDTGKGEAVEAPLNRQRGGGRGPRASVPRRDRAVGPHARRSTASPPLSGPSRPPTPPLPGPCPCYRRHSRKSSSATLHSSPVRNLLLSHSGSIFSNSKIVLALWGQKPGTVLRLQPRSTAARECAHTCTCTRMHAPAHTTCTHTKHTRKVHTHTPPHSPLHPHREPDAWILKVQLVCRIQK